MPANHGSLPGNIPERVDLQLRNGHICRAVDGKKYRWKPWPDGESGGDIVAWQPARKD